MAKQREWDLDSDVLQAAAVYLARSSYNDLCNNSSQIVDITNPELLLNVDHLSASEMSANHDDGLVDMLMGVVRTVFERDAKIVDPLYYSTLIGAICAWDYAAQAEQILEMAWKAKPDYIGISVASMMSMYYRQQNSAKANALFSRFSEFWAQRRNSIVVLSDVPRLGGQESTELPHGRDSSALDSSTQPTTANRLQAVHTSAGGPFCQRALELIREKQVEEAAAFIDNAKNACRVGFSKAHLDLLVKALLEQQCLDQVYTLCMNALRNGRSGGAGKLAAQESQFSEAPSTHALSCVVAELGAVGDWDRVWTLINSAWTEARTDPDIECMQRLLVLALDSKDSCQAVKLAQRLLAIISRNRLAASAITDEWIANILCTALKLTNGLVPSKSHPFVDITHALVLIDVTPNASKLDVSESRVMRCAYRLLEGKSVPGATDIIAELDMKIANSLRNVAKTSAGCTDYTNYTDRRQQKSQLLNRLVDVGSRQQIQSAAPEPLKIGASYSQMKSWYVDMYECGLVPHLPLLLKILSQAQKQHDHEFWDTIVYGHLPELLERLKVTTPEEKRESVLKSYQQEVWSSGIRAHALLNEIEEAVECFGRVIAAGGYPIAEACAALLDALASQNTSLPVLAADQIPASSAICGMKPAYLPQGDSPLDKYIIAKSPKHHRMLVAEMGLAMLYSLLQHNNWPGVYFYSVLIAALVRARMVDELRHIFEVVMPVAMRKVPAHLRVFRGFMPSPFTWLMAIRGAIKCGDTMLADKWFSEYRMSAMPLFREESSAYIRFESKRFSKHSLLAQLALPYYSMSHIPRPRTSDGVVPTPWYDLQQVEQQLEIDRLRALDKLPMPFTGAAKLLAIFTRVDEHRNVDRAEELADEISALFVDTHAPRYVRPVSHVELAGCWKSMVFGYISAIKLQQQELVAGLVEPSSVKRLQVRLAFWYREWAAACNKVSLSKNDQLGKAIRLSKAHREFAEDVCRRLNLPVN
ncbi:hypothetical protein GGH19_000986 [Coemansia sp. RSA 1807]|nr:hypothetical protein GGH19_000986 [Coemansia sp. RSA 1807]